MFSLVVTTAPTAEPVTLAEAKAQLRVAEAIHHEDDRIEALITAAREYAEEFTGRALMTQTIRMTLDAFPAGVICLPKPPVQSVTSVTYVETDGTSTVLVADTDYRVDTYSEPARIEPIDDTWPATDERLNAVTIIYVAGYTEAGLVPQRVKQAMLLLIKDWFEEGESRISDTVQKRANDLLRSAWAGSLAGTFA